MADRIYFDHNATAPVLPEAAAARAEASSLGNPSSVHWAGRAARVRLDDAREQVAAALGARPKDVAFVSGGSEANALALWGAYLGRSDSRRVRILASAIEHPSVLSTLSQLERIGARVERIPVGSDGVIDLSAAVKGLGPDVALLSVMAANNETGVLQPLAELALAAHAAGALLHCDAVQAAGRIELNTLAHCADLLSLSGHKFGAGPGAGVLLVRPGVPLAPLSAGHQEGGRRAGTEDVPACAALAVALRASCEALPQVVQAVAQLRDRLENGLRSLPGAQIIAARSPRLCNTTNVCFPGAAGEAVLIALDLVGIAASSGAACASGTLEPSHVLLAMGLSPELARGSLRFSLGVENSPAEVDRLLAVLPAIVAAARDADAPD